jgi:sulfoxide reductase heme-binding subunit YedZ
LLKNFNLDFTIRLSGILLPILPLLWLIAAILTGRTTANPVQYLEQRSGDYALTMLLASLACTPLRIITGKSVFLHLRKILGLFAFGYAVVHLLLFIALDYGWDWSLILAAFKDNVFLWIGLSSFISLLLLAITSFTRLQKGMGKWWKRLHLLAYAAGLLAILHFALSIKGNILTLEGNYLVPLLVFAGMVLLLIIRLKPVQRLFRRLGGKINPRNGSNSNP